jgi:hypothetical protein
MVQALRSKDGSEAIEQKSSRNHERLLHDSFSTITDILYGALIGYALVLLADSVKLLLSGIYDAGVTDDSTRVVLFLVFNKIKLYGVHTSRDASARAVSEIAVAAAYFGLLCLAELRSPLIILAYAALHALRILWLSTQVPNPRPVAGQIIAEIMTGSQWVFALVRPEFYGLSLYEPGGMPLARLSVVNSAWSIVNSLLVPAYLRRQSRR